MHFPAIWNGNQMILSIDISIRMKKGNVMGHVVRGTTIKYPRVRSSRSETGGTCKESSRLISMRSGFFLEKVKKLFVLAVGEFCRYKIIIIRVGF